MAKGNEKEQMKVCKWKHSDFNKGRCFMKFWERCNVMVIGLITCSFSNHIAQSIIYIDKSKELWKDLQEMYSNMFLIF